MANVRMLTKPATDVGAAQVEYCAVSNRGRPRLEARHKGRTVPESVVAAEYTGAHREEEFPEDWQIKPATFRPATRLRKAVA
jgi:hypothetical protein